MCGVVWCGSGGGGSLLSHHQWSMNFSIISYMCTFKVTTGVDHHIKYEQVSKYSTKKCVCVRFDHFLWNVSLE